MTDDDRYRAVLARDARFDGVFFTAVRTTGIFCRPSCPAVTPKRENVSFYRDPASAQAAGYRACRRCRPDVTPGSPEWNIRGDLAARTMRLIADGVVEREGVTGLARRLGYSERQVHRTLVDELGVSPLAVARSNRAHLARTLIESTDLPLADIAFASGFGSIRQFNDTMRTAYAVVPSALRRGSSLGGGRLELRLAVRPPFDADALIAFLAARAVRGVEHVEERRYARVVSLPHGPGVIDLVVKDDAVQARLELTDLADLQATVQRCRRLLDLDADPVTIDAALAADPKLAPLIERHPGLRLPGQVDGFEVVVRAVVGQQISVAGARTVLGDLAHRHGAPVDLPMAGELGLSRAFPSPEDLLGAVETEFPMPRSRARTLLAVAQGFAAGDVVVDSGVDRSESRRMLLGVKGIGPWTADYIAMRALGDPDVLPMSDLVLRRALASRGLDEQRAEEWRPWRSYAAMHLWQSATDERTDS